MLSVSKFANTEDAMNFINGLDQYKTRKGYKKADLARLLGVSDSVVSQYFSGKSWMSLDNLAKLLRDGMTLEEAFGEETAAAIKKGIARDGTKKSDALGIVLQGLKEIVSVLENGESP